LWQEDHHIPVSCFGNDLELSPGTTLLWDYGYSVHSPIWISCIAAVLFTRVVSKPAKDLICLDLGHKAVGSEMPQPRIMIPGIDDLSFISHSEEHLLIKTSHGGQ